MAAVKLVCLLAALINGVHGQNTSEHRTKGGSLMFDLPKDAEFCVISRSMGAENLVLWNTSVPSPNDTLLPQELKNRQMRLDSSVYLILNLTYSDAGLYREKCWSDGYVTHQKDITVTVCDVVSDLGLWLKVTTGETVTLPCEGAGTDMTVHWLKSKDLSKTSPLTRLFLDDNRSLNPLMKQMEGRVQLEGNKSSLQISSLTKGDFLGVKYYCLIMDGQQCVQNRHVLMFPESEYLYYSEGEEAVLPCFDPLLYGPPTHWKRNHVEKEKTFPVLPQNHTEMFSDLTEPGKQDASPEEPVVKSQNSLVFSSLSLFHNGVLYECHNDQYMRSYFLLVCPGSVTNTQVFSEGDEVTLSCRSHVTDRRSAVWIRQDGATIGPYSPREKNPKMDQRFKGRVKMSFPLASVVLSNLSLADSGEYRCVIYDLECVFLTKTILIYNETGERKNTNKNS